MMSEGKAAKVVITKADNGFIVKTEWSGLGFMKEPFIKPLSVYNSKKDLYKYLDRIFGNVAGVQSENERKIDEKE